MRTQLVYLRAVRLMTAYIDPGTGSLIVQALIAAIVAVPLFFRTQIARAVRAVRGDGERNEERGDRTAGTS